VCLAWQFVVQTVIFAVTLENDVKCLVISNHYPTNVSTFSLFTYCNSSSGSYLNAFYWRMDKKFVVSH
jgi:hypothetical protein